MFSTFAAFSGLAFFLGLRTTGFAIVVLSFLMRARGFVPRDGNELLGYAVRLTHRTTELTCSSWLGRPGEDQARIRTGARRSWGANPSHHPAGHRLARHRQAVPSRPGHRPS